MIQSIPEGILLDVRVVPRAAGKAGPAGPRDGALLVRLHRPPVDGAANVELIDVLSTVLDVPRRAVAIVAGERSRRKRLRIAGIDAATAAKRLTP